MADKIYISQEMEFEKIRKCYKRFQGATFNDYMLGQLSVSLDQWYKKNSISGAQKLSILSPINARPLPS